MIEGVSSVARQTDTLPVVWDLDVYRGDSWSQEFRFLRDDAPIDLSGATVEAWARNGVNGDTSPLVVVVDDPTDGRVVLHMPPDGLPWQTYAYDVEVDLDGVVQTWVRGKLRVHRDVTNEVPLT